MCSQLEKIKRYGEDQVQLLKEYGFQKFEDALANPYAQALSKIVNSAVDLTDKTVDYYLPPSDEEMAEQESLNGNSEGETVVDPNAVQVVVKKVGVLSNKMRRRVLRQASISLQTLQKRSQEALDQMKNTVDLIQYAKSMEDAGRQRLSGSLSNLSNGARNLWNELNKEVEAENEQSGQTTTLDQRLLNVARRATKRFNESYMQLIKAYSSVLPENIRINLEASSAYAKDVLNQLSSVSSIRELSDIAIKQMAMGAEAIQTLMVKTLTPIMGNIGVVVPTNTETTSTTETSGTKTTPQPKSAPCSADQSPEPNQSNFESSFESTFTS